MPACPQLHTNFQDLSLEQMVEEPTHLDNTLDLIITNTPHFVPGIEVFRGVSNPDVVYWKFVIHCRKKK